MSDVESRKPRGLALDVVIERVVELLRERGTMTKAELVDAIGDTTEQTVQRAFNFLKEEHPEAGLDYDKTARAWGLSDRDFSLPTRAPTSDDLDAVTVATALLEPLVDEEMFARLQRLYTHLDDARVSRARRGDPPVRHNAVRCTLSLATPLRSSALQRLLRCLRRSRIQVTYHSPWREPGATVAHELEPWELRIHDGTPYLRAYCYRAAAGRTFRVVELDSDSLLDLGTAQQPVPRASELWGTGDPAYGIDEHDPAIATVLLEGPVARWVAPIRWHPEQRDQWVQPQRLLRRTIPYRSRREFARRVLTVIDAVVDLEPPALVDEIRALIPGWVLESA